MDLPFDRVSGPSTTTSETGQTYHPSILFYYDLFHSSTAKGSFDCQVTDLLVPFFIVYVSHATHNSNSTLLASELIEE